jgi:hypothetical protein
MLQTFGTVPQRFLDLARSVDAGGERMDMVCEIGGLNEKDRAVYRESLPSWLGNIAEWLPVAPFVKVATWAYVPATTTPWNSLGLLISWGIVGLLIVPRRRAWRDQRGGR